MRSLSWHANTLLKIGAVPEKAPCWFVLVCPWRSLFGVFGYVTSKLLCTTTKDMSMLNTLLWFVEILNLDDLSTTWNPFFWCKSDLHQLSCSRVSDINGRFAHRVHSPLHYFHFKRNFHEFKPAGELGEGENNDEIWISLEMKWTLMISLALTFWNDAVVFSMYHVQCLEPVNLGFSPELTLPHVIFPC